MNSVEVLISYLTVCLGISATCGNDEIMRETCFIVQMVHTSVELFRKRRRPNRMMKNRFGKNATYVEGIVRIYLFLFGELVGHILDLNMTECRRCMLDITDVLQRVIAKYKASLKRSCWVRQVLLERPRYSEYNHLVKSMRLGDRGSFFSSFRMTPERFDELLRKVGPLICRKNTFFRRAVTPQEKLAVTLRYLAHGDDQNMLALSYRLGYSTVSKAIKETLKALWDTLSPEFLKTPTAADWRSIAVEFQQMWNFPNCVGAIDGKHVRIQKPANGGSSYFNYKGYHSLVLMAVCTADYRFSVVEFGMPGRESDGGIFNNMDFGQDLVNRGIDLPDAQALPETDVVMPYVFVADDAFPLLHNLMKPYTGKALQKEQHVFNYRLSRARRTIENAFGILAARWRIYHREIVAAVDTVDKIIGATVCLHNYLMTRDQDECSMHNRYCPDGFADEIHNSELQHGRWRDSAEVTNALTEIQARGQSQATKRSKLIRQAFQDYFNCEAGRLAWQYTIVSEGLLNT